MRRLLVLAVLAALFASASVPAMAAKKKKPRKPPPVTFEASGTLAIGHPGTAEDAALTQTEFENTCAIPASQGVDGFVVELSEEISKVTANVGVTGTDAAGLIDLDMYFYDEACASVGAASTEAPQEVGIFPAGTKYVLVAAWAGAEIAFDLTATEMR